MYLRGSILRYKGYYYVQDENGKTIDLGDIESINLSRIDDEIVKRDF